MVKNVPLSIAPRFFQASKVQIDMLLCLINLNALSLTRTEWQGFRICLQVRNKIRKEENLREGDKLLKLFRPVVMMEEVISLYISFLFLYYVLIFFLLAVFLSVSFSAVPLFFPFS